MGSSVGGCDLDVGVATWSALVGQKRRRDRDLMSRHGRQCGRSRHGFRCRDLEIPLWAETRSRHEIDVATRLGTGQEKRCHDPVLRSRPALA